MLLAPRQLEPTLTHRGLIAIGQRFYKRVNMREFSRLLDVLLARFQLCVRQIVPDGVIEQHRVLRNNANGLAHTVLLDVANILPID